MTEGQDPNWNVVSLEVAYEQTNSHEKRKEIKNCEILAKQCKLIVGLSKEAPGKMIIRKQDRSKQSNFLFDDIHEVLMFLQGYKTALLYCVDSVIRLAQEL